MSETVGRHFTGNGDVLGFAYDGDRPVHAVGYGHHRPGELHPVGPCITSMIDMRGGSRELEQGMVIEEGVTPGALAHLLPGALAANAGTQRHLPTTLAEGARRGDSLVHGAYQGPVDNTQTFLVMAHDDANGSMRLQNGRLRIDWPGIGSQATIQDVHAQLKRAAEASGATYLKNPLRTNFATSNLITVHPLGGAAMADRADTGVVNHKGQVFSGADGEDVYGDLYVCDGSVMPMSLGVNPLLTITALSERTVALLARERGWDISYTLPSTPREQASVATAGIEFTERMKGFLSTQGREKTPFEFILSIRSNDVVQMLRDEQHAARINGSVQAPALSAAALTVTDGHFHLFTVDPDAVNTRRMWYRMKLHSAEGGTYYFEGYKRIQNRQGLNVWRDTTTLFITVYRGDDREGPVLGTGILKIAPSDFLKQLTTMRVFNAANSAERLRLTAEFGKFFAGQLFEVYVRSRDT
jgi:cholesterol oxidase